MITDPIADYLTRVRNAISADHRVVEMPASKIKKEIKKTTGAINIISETSLANIQGEEDAPEGKKKIRQILTPENFFHVIAVNFQFLI